MNMFIEYLKNNYTIREVGDECFLPDGTCPFCGRSSRTKIYVNKYKSKKLAQPCGVCHHCGQGFSAISFVSAAEGCQEKEAHAILNGLDDGFVRTQEEVVASNIAPFPENAELILVGDPAYTYLLKRGIGADLIKRYNLHFCYGNFYWNDSLLSTANRIIIPIYNKQGELETWQGRDITGLAKNKYYFPPGFSISNLLYNVQNYDLSSNYVIICEGVMDVIGWERNGYCNAFATFGKKISCAQIDILLSLNVNTIYLAWDSDANQLKDLFMSKYQRHFKNIYFVDLNGMDSDEMEATELHTAIHNSRFHSDWGSRMLKALGK